MIRKESSVPKYRNLQATLTKSSTPASPAENKRKETTYFNYPYPAEPRDWTREERLYGQGLRRLFDILFSRKVQNVLIADDAITTRNIKPGSVTVDRLAEGLGEFLDISQNESITTLQGDVADMSEDISDMQTAVETAQSTADAAASAAAAVQNTVMPIGIIIIKDTAPAFGTWQQVDIGLAAGFTAWQRTA